MGAIVLYSNAQPFGRRVLCEFILIKILTKLTGNCIYTITLQADNHLMYLEGGHYGQS